MSIAFVYVTDERGFELAIHSAMSVALSQSGPCDVHVFCHRFWPERVSEFRAAMADVGADLTFHLISDPALEHHKTHGHVTTPSLLKLTAVMALIARYDRLVYLDNDILVFEHLNIDSIDFGSTPHAAVVDMDLSPKGWLRQSTYFSGHMKLHTVGLYFNAGFMIFDSVNLRHENYLSAYENALVNHERHCPFKIDCTSPDQCALNTIFEGNWSPLALGFNMQAGAKFTKHWRTALVRHFCGTRKFLPMSLFRNDGRDVRFLNLIRDRLGLPKTRFPLLYEALFRLNVVRKYRSDLLMRQYLGALQSLSSLPQR